MTAAIGAEITASRRSGPPPSCCVVSPYTPMESSRPLAGPGRRTGVSSSARTCSAPARSRSAAPTSGSPGCPMRRSARGVVAAIAPATTRRVSRWPRVAARLDGNGLHAGRRVHRQTDRHPRLRRARRAGGRDPGRRPGRGAGLRAPAPARCWSTPSTIPTCSRGQGTVGLEILEQVPDVATVVVAAGGGGLLSGVAAVLRSAAPGCPDRRGAGRAGRRLAGLAAAGPPGPAAQDVHAGRRHRRGRTVRADLCACQPTGRRHRHGVRGSAVAGHAALPGTGEAGGRAGRGGSGGGDHGRSGPVHARRWSPCCPAATSIRWCCCTSRSTAWWPRGRFLSLRSEIIDRPGSLAALLALVGELGGNVVDVEHSRLGSALPLGDVEVALRTGNPGCRALRRRSLRALTAAGFRVLRPTVTAAGGRQDGRVRWGTRPSADGLVSPSTAWPPSR